MNNYRIKLDDACTVFSLYRGNIFMGAERWIGQHLLDIAGEHHIDVSMCQSESHMLSILEEHLSIEIE